MCDDVHDWRGVSVEDLTEWTTESRRQSYRRPAGAVSCNSEEVQLSQRLTEGAEAGLCQLATDCLRVFRYSFVAFNLAESVSLCVLFWVVLLT